METLSKKEIKSIAGALERATQNLLRICAMMLKKERKAKKGKCGNEDDPVVLM